MREAQVATMRPWIKKINDKLKRAHGRRGKSIAAKRNDVSGRTAGRGYENHLGLFRLPDRWCQIERYEFQTGTRPQYFRGDHPSTKPPRDRVAMFRGTCQRSSAPALSSRDRGRKLGGRR